jgi:ribA/ribD-fused uncharacterized protein
MTLVVHYFRGYLDPLSNFHFADMVIDGDTYAHVEQYYQSEKARRAGQPGMAVRIKFTGDPRKCRKMGEEIVTYWDRSEREAVMLKGLRAKFSQNPHLKKALMDLPRDVCLAFDNSCDSYWGTGLRDGDVWAGHNRLGVLLMRLKKELCEE